MKKIDTQNWKEYQIQELFKVEKGNRLTKADMEDGDINFIGASKFNNGVTKRISNYEKDKIFPGNSITVNYNGSVGEAFFQEEQFWASDDVNVLLPKFKMTKNIALFICPIIRTVGRRKYEFTDKWDKSDMEKDCIKLPAQKNGQPDFDYMEKYISEKTKLVLKNIENLMKIISS